MKRQDYLKLALVMAAAGTMMAITPAHAEDTTTPAPMGKMGGPGEMFKNADTNSDGFLTREEMLKAHEARVDKMFVNLDTDEDSKLSQSEMKAGRDKMRERMKERREGRRDGTGRGQ